MAGSKYSVTLTGKIRSGRDAPAVWARVALLLRLGDTAFRERVLARVPVTLKAVDYASAMRQLEALTAAGADARMLADEPEPRVWMRRAGRTCGPLTQAYARFAMHAGDVPGDMLACLHGSTRWQPLQTLLGRKPPADASITSKPPDRPASAGNASGGMSGSLLVVLVIGGSLSLLALLAVLLGLVPL